MPLTERPLLLNNGGMTEEISLFPIPGAVSLPYSVKPLHIFEPRYRVMIKDSVEKNRRIGVAHTKKLIPSKSQHENFEAYEVFSAGFAEILETLPDGRMIVQIKMNCRYQIESELQQVPFKVVRCSLYEDEPPKESNEAFAKIRGNLDQTLIDLAGQVNPEYKKYIESDEWKLLSMDEYSYAIYSLVLFEADILQKVLEMRSSYDRISFLQDKLFTKVLQ